ncbi:MAG: extracellular solute-binding protein, partial [Erysipelotrichaceae bacterium]|nr:extracellular solute-binding protein [Erysipelotrichaceae bacterium]
MTRKKIIGIGIIVIALLLGGAYVRYLQTNTLTLGMYVGSSWGVYENDGYQTLGAAIELFEQQTGIKVKYESGIRKEDYSTWLAQKIVSGKAPDVMIVLPDDFNFLASIGAFVDVNDVLNEEEKEQYYRTSLLAGNYEGVQYALPFESNPMLMCVNQDILEKEGIRIPDKWSVKDFYDICQKVTKDTNGDGIIDQFGCYNYTWENALDSYGLSVFNSLGTICNINSDEHKEAIGYVQKLMNLNEGYQVSSKDFDAGKVAFRPMSMAEYRTYAPYPYRISKYADFNWHCIPMPSGNNTEYFTSCDTALIAVYTKSNNKEA